MPLFTYARFHPQGYECSSRGDHRFSALFAMIDDESIESHYQLTVKGYRQITDDWRFAKGKPPLNKMHPDDTWKAYKGLWELWAQENPELIEELRRLAVHGVLTDCFATTPISQARALSEILNDSV